MSNVDNILIKCSKLKYSIILIRIGTFIDGNISAGNLIINIDASNNLIYINGVVDNYSLNYNSNYKKIAVDEIIENEEKLYFDFKNDLLTDYDIISTNQENKFDFFQLDSTDAVLDLYKIFQLKEGNNLASINGIISDYKDDS